MHYFNPFNLRRLPCSNYYFTYNFNIFVNSIENFRFLETNLETVLARVLHPHGHCILRSLWSLVTRGYKYDWG